MRLRAGVPGKQRHLSADAATLPESRPCCSTARSAWRRAAAFFLALVPRPRCRSTRRAPSSLALTWVIWSMDSDDLIGRRDVGRDDQQQPLRGRDHRLGVGVVRSRRNVEDDHVGQALELRERRTDRCVLEQLGEEGAVRTGGNDEQVGRVGDGVHRLGRADAGPEHVRQAGALGDTEGLPDDVGLGVAADQRCLDAAAGEGDSQARCGGGAGDVGRRRGHHQAPLVAHQSGEQRVAALPQGLVVRVAVALHAFGGRQREPADQYVETEALEIAARAHPVVAPVADDGGDQPEQETDEQAADQDQQRTEAARGGRLLRLGDHGARLDVLVLQRAELGGAGPDLLDQQGALRGQVGAARLADDPLQVVVDLDQVAVERVDRCPAGGPRSPSPCPARAPRDCPDMPWRRSGPPPGRWLRTTPRR